MRNALLAWWSFTADWLLQFSKTNCFDAFPFYLNWSRNKKCSPKMKNAYGIFQQMIRQKKPDVILCAWQPPKGFEEAQYCSKEIEITNETKTVMVCDKLIKLFNAFHSSYAIHFHSNESCFRQLFLLETAKAFANLNNRWKKEPWCTP